MKLVNKKYNGSFFTPCLDSIKVVLLTGLLSVCSCKKFVEVNSPITGLASSSVYSNNSTAASVLTGIYSNMLMGGLMSSGSNSIGYLTGLSSDELTNYSSDPVLSAYYTNNLNASADGTIFWDEIYREIYVTNAAIEGVTSSSSLKPSTKQQLLGEAKFMRAFFYFYAVNLYGDVPLITTTNYTVNSVAGRSSRDKVYLQIIADLKDAQASLSNNYVDATGLMTTERIRPNKGVATALLARVYLYSGDWANAEAQATAVINNTAYSLSTLDNVFLKASLGNNEAIWQLQPVAPGYNTYDGQYYILTSSPGQGLNYVSLSNNFLNSFEVGDSRLTNWIGSFTTGVKTYYYPYKYKIGTISTSNPVNEYTMVFRLAEQYLIRAEARAEGTGAGLQGAVNDLNVIRRRAGLPNYSGDATNKTGVLAAILHERQVELFTEWGNRWLDLKRTGNINAVMQNVAPQKGGSWSGFKQFFPIPITDIASNPKLTQTPGY